MYGRNATRTTGRHRRSPPVAAAAAERLYATRRYEPALAAYLDAAEGWQRVRARRPAELEPNVHVAMMLLGAGRCFRKLRRYEEAAQVLVGAEAIAALPDPAPYRDQISMTQQVQALVVSKM